MGADWAQMSQGPRFGCLDSLKSLLSAKSVKMTGIGCFALVEGHHEFLVGFSAKPTKGDGGLRQAAQSGRRGLSEAF
jgi:hypothetical protein